MELTLNLDRAEQQLVQALLSGERWAQKQVYEENYGPMMGICMRYAGTRDEATDLLHESFIKAFSKIALYNPGTSFHKWLKTIVVNTCIDYYRKNNRRRTEDLDSLEVNQMTAQSDPDILSRISETEILEAVQQLSPAYRAVFNLFVVEGYNHKEIGEALDITESTSRSNLLKARIKLQEYFSTRKMTF